MHVLTDLRFYLYTAVASVMMTYTSHHREYHDLSLWFLGVLGHAIGAASKATNGTPS